MLHWCFLAAASKSARARFCFVSSSSSFAVCRRRRRHHYRHRGCCCCCCGIRLKPCSTPGERQSQRRILHRTIPQTYKNRANANPPLIKHTDTLTQHSHNYTCTLAFCRDTTLTHTHTHSDTHCCISAILSSLRHPGSRLPERAAALFTDVASAAIASADTWFATLWGRSAAVRWCDAAAYRCRIAQSAPSAATCRQLLRHQSPHRNHRRLERPWLERWLVGCTW